MWFPLDFLIFCVNIFHQLILMALLMHIFFYENTKKELYYCSFSVWKKSSMQKAWHHSYQLFLCRKKMSLLSVLYQMIHNNGFNSTVPTAKTDNKKESCVV